MVINKYPDGEIEVWNGDVCVILKANGKITYNLEVDGEFLYSYDFLPYVGQIWKPKVMEILNGFEIVVDRFESATEYRDCWTSHGIAPYDPNFKGEK